ncbi:hypothetical protein SD70_32185 [Gordoniibacillus kamchatkensis]|uniref:Uncharacterized protein n=1 Tax=Gordoniibacillus kamchatkensis TaxID=1590651 RepID=A0ABR5A4F9_9BACL|nr:hypothetical protein [Paenibacillus sp. VKM B-2647]KIL35523.1 hypothetical protein SD70_32185 [Paenibacillus sp. VKM B-2647]
MTQAQQYVVPCISLIEMPPRPTPATGVTVGTIGIVGTFCKGPIGVPTTVYSLNDAIRQFGGYASGLTGYMSVLGAFRQGANRIVIVRCASSSAQKAKLELSSSAAPRAQRRKRSSICSITLRLRPFPPR